MIFLQSKNYSSSSFLRRQNNYKLHLLFSKEKIENTNYSYGQSLGTLCATQYLGTIYKIIHVCYLNQSYHSL